MVDEDDGAIALPDGSWVFCAKVRLRIQGSGDDSSGVVVVARMLATQSYPDQDKENFASSSPRARKYNVQQQQQQQKYVGLQVDQATEENARKHFAGT